MPTDGDRRALLGRGHHVCVTALLRKQQAAWGGRRHLPLQGSNHKAAHEEGWHPLGTVWGGEHSLTGHCQQEAPLFAVTAGQ